MSTANESATTLETRAFQLLRTVFVIAPIVFGLDKFTNVLTDWTIYLAPWINDIVPGNAQDAMYVVGVIEIAAGFAGRRRSAFRRASWSRPGSPASSSTCSRSPTSTTSPCATSVCSSPPSPWVCWPRARHRRAVQD